MSDDSHEYDEEVFATIGEIHESMVLDDPLYKKGYQAGAASRDAEIAKWKAIAANKADQVDAAKEVIAEVKEERNQLRAHINMLRFYGRSFYWFL